MKNKKEYKIGEVAALFDINTSVLRFWEKEFPWIVPQRTEKKHRVYTDESIQRVKIIHYLLYNQGLTIEGAKRLLATRLKDGKIPKNIEEVAMYMPSQQGQTQCNAPHMNSIIEELEELRSMLEGK